MALSSCSLLTSCGDDTTTDSDTERGQEYVDAAVSVVVGAVRRGRNRGPTGRPSLHGGARSSTRIGLDTLDEAQVTPEEFAEAENLPAVGLEISEDQARDAAEGQLACLDLVEIFVLDQSTDEETECARNALDTHMEALRESLKDELLGASARRICPARSTSCSSRSATSPSTSIDDQLKVARISS